MKRRELQLSVRLKGKTGADSSSVDFSAQGKVSFTQNHFTMGSFKKKKNNYRCAKLNFLRYILEVILLVM